MKKASFTVYNTGLSYLRYHTENIYLCRNDSAQIQENMSFCAAVTLFKMQNLIYVFTQPAA